MSESQQPARPITIDVPTFEDRVATREKLRKKNEDRELRSSVQRELVKEQEEQKHQKLVEQISQKERRMAQMQHEKQAAAQQR